MSPPANCSRPTDDYLHMAFKLYCTDILRFDDEEGDGRLGLFCSDEDVISDNSASGDECQFFTNPKDIHPPLDPDAMIDSFDG